MSFEGFASAVEGAEGEAGGAEGEGEKWCGKNDGEEGSDLGKCAETGSGGTCGEGGINVDVLILASSDVGIFMGSIATQRNCSGFGRGA